MMMGLFRADHRHDRQYFPPELGHDLRDQRPRRGHLHRPDRLRHPKIRASAKTPPLDDATAIRRGALLGALTLYLDFINLFLMLLRLMGDRR